MFFSKIKIKKLLNIENYEIEINKPIVVFKGREYRDLVYALSAMANNSLFYSDIAPTKESFEGTCVDGEFIGENKLWQVHVSQNPYYKEEIYKGRTVVVGKKLHAEYIVEGKELESHHALNVFNGISDENAQFWFRGYSAIDGEDPCRKKGFPSDIDHKTYLSNVYKSAKKENNKVVLKIVEDVLKDFKPEPLDCYKYSQNYLFINFDKERGFYCCENPNDDKFVEIENLSAGDQLVFDYLCFVYVNKFCYKLQEAYHNLYKHEPYLIKKPLFVFNLVGYMDEAIDDARLLKKASELGCQVFVFLGLAEASRWLLDCPDVQIIDCPSLTK